MQNNERNILIAYGIFGLTFGLFCLWFVFSWTGLVHHAEAAIVDFLPGWFLTFNLLLGPCLLAVAAGMRRIPVALRFFLAALMLWSILIFEASFRRYLWASCIVLAVFLLEAYWIIPRWNTRRRGEGGSS